MYLFICFFKDSEVVIINDDDEASDDEVQIVQVTGPAPISIADDDGGGGIEPPVS